MVGVLTLHHPHHHFFLLLAVLALVDVEANHGEEDLSTRLTRKQGLFVTSDHPFNLLLLLANSSSHPCLLLTAFLKCSATSCSSWDRSTQSPLQAQTALHLRRPAFRHLYPEQNLVLSSISCSFPSPLSPPPPLLLLRLELPWFLQPLPLRHPGDLIA